MLLTLGITRSAGLRDSYQSKIWSATFSQPGSPQVK